MAQNAASQSGLDPALLKKMLPMLAMLSSDSWRNKLVPRPSAGVFGTPWIVNAGQMIGN